MASAENDPLLLLRGSIAQQPQAPFFPTASAEPDAPEVGLAQATHLHFTRPSAISVPLDVPTRFVNSKSQAVDLRSIYFTWVNKDVNIANIATILGALNEELAGRATVQPLAYVERLDLITWLEGASDHIDFIQELPGEKDVGIAGATKSQSAAVPSRAGRGTLDPRLAIVYGGERGTGDHNTALRGIKPTVRSLSLIPLHSVAKD